MEVTNALAVGYADPALEGQTITFTCPPGQILNESNSSTCRGNREWEPDPSEIECTGGMGTTGVTTSGMSALNIAITRYLFFIKIIACFIPGPAVVCNNNPLYVLHINDSTKESSKEVDANNMCCSGFLIARTNLNTTVCLENGEWELETSQPQTEGD